MEVINFESGTNLTFVQGKFEIEFHEFRRFQLSLE
jgi:hypothetical protein